MPKMKTHKVSQRRFKITGNGIIMRTKGMKGHFRRRRSSRVKRSLDRYFPLDETQVKRVKKLLPYGVPK